MVLWAQFVAGSHFRWGMAMRYFYNPSYNKTILLLHNYLSKQGFLLLFLVFDNVTITKVRDTIVLQYTFIATAEPFYQEAAPQPTKCTSNLLAQWLLRNIVNTVFELGFLTFLIILYIRINDTCRFFINLSKKF